MKNKSLTLVAGIMLSLGAFSALTNTIDADDFVESASASGIAEIEAGKLALQKSISPQVKVFAQKMIDDHTAANSELGET